MFSWDEMRREWLVLKQTIKHTNIKTQNKTQNKSMSIFYGFGIQLGDY